MSKRGKVSSGTVQARVRHNIPLYLMFLPGAIYLLINNYIPMAGLVIAFKQVNWNKGILKSPWVGFSNFEYLFKTKEAWNITRNTLGYNIVFIILGTVIAIAVAILHGAEKDLPDGDSAAVPDLHGRGQLPGLRHAVQ